MFGRPNHTGNVVTVESASNNLAANPRRRRPETYSWWVRAIECWRDQADVI
jgi:hypothetical protein